MHLIIISCTPRAVKASNTDKIITGFRKGFEAAGNTSETHYLVNRKSWETIRRAFAENREILFAIPLFVECIPGLMVEFLETLSPKSDAKGAIRTRISFILQGGFGEASQLRCGERYLEMLPGYLNCDYNGTLIKGNCFPISLLPEKVSAGMVMPFSEMGKMFAEDGRFDKVKVSAFAKPEYFSKGYIFLSHLIMPLNKLFFTTLAKKLGCKENLAAKPYADYLEQ